MEHRTYDIVFAGGGTAACLIAGRLAAANPDLKILLIEGGEHVRDKPEHIQPALYRSHLAPTSTTVTFHQAKPSEDVKGRAVIVPCGRCVGGGSSINFVMYTRAAASDYDDWEQLHGNPGWGSKDLIPLLQKTETYQINPGEPTHGYSGPLKVSWGGAYSNVAQQFLDVAAQIDKNRPVVEDINDLSSGDNYGRWPRWIDRDTGKRSDVAHHFIYNQSDNKNLELLTGSKVKRVIFEGNRAVGVEYVNDTTLNRNASQTIQTVRASKLVVISAGSFGSPLILERSGVGNPDILQKHDINVKVDLVGVGENYNDHNAVASVYIAGQEAETLDAFFRGEQDVVADALKTWQQGGQGLIASNGIDSGAKIRPNSQELKELGPAFEARWKKYFEKAPDKPVLWMGPISYVPGPPNKDLVGKFFAIGWYTEYPVSNGRVHISSGDDANAPADFESGYLSDPADVAVLVWGYKKQRELARRMGLYRGELPPGHPPFAPESGAACSGPAAGPVDINTPPITYSQADDEVLEDYVRRSAQTTWHSLGTCAMKPREKGGVVDPRLNVYGVSGLKVADLSIAPSNVGANTYSTTLVIAEKAALIMAEDLGLVL